MTTASEFETQLTDLRPRLHRYCARMTGSSVDGEDVVQEVLIKAMGAWTDASEINNVEGWLFRIAHNASLDFLRARTRARANVVPLVEEMVAGTDHPNPQVIAASFRTFLELPVLPRCAVILRDVLGYSVEEIANITDSSVPTAKSALQRGRQRLKALVTAGDEGPRLPLMDDDQRARLRNFVASFRAGDFDAIRQMLADDVRVDLVNRLTLEGKKAASPYFTRYAEISHWRYAFGAVDGRPAMLVYDSRASMDRPAYFVIPQWHAGQIKDIKDFLFAPYAMEACEWVLLEPLPW